VLAFTATQFKRQSFENSPEEFVIEAFVTARSVLCPAARAGLSARLALRVKVREEKPKSGVSCGKGKSVW
jgi:hypothetical protein